MERIKKVVMYVVKVDHLLVFTHIDFPLEVTGVQVPAGTIREQDEVEKAALRELQEETGHVSFRIIRKLGSAEYDARPQKSELHERHFFLAEPTVELPHEWFSQENHDGEKEPTRFKFFWIPLEQAHVLSAGFGAFLHSIER